MKKFFTIMKKVNSLLEFLLENIEDKRFSVYKKYKYGFKNYYLNFYVDEDPVTKQTQQNIYQFRDGLEIVFDNRNKCIEIDGLNEDRSIIIEDLQLLEKWSNILEEILNENVEKRIVDIFEKTLESCYNKNLHRELQMKKIFQ